MLPLDVWTAVFGYMSVTDVYKLRQVSRSMLSTVEACDWYWYDVYKELVAEYKQGDVTYCSKKNYMILCLKKMVSGWTYRDQLTYRQLKRRKRLYKSMQQRIATDNRRETSAARLYLRQLVSYVQHRMYSTGWSETNMVHANYLLLKFVRGMNGKQIESKLQAFIETVLPGCSQHVKSEIEHTAITLEHCRNTNLYDFV